MSGALDSLLARFRAVDLHTLDERAALLQRVDVKYVVDWETFAALCERLRDEHEVLELDGRRIFNYETVYFDTPDLRCYREHEEGQVPRFKARTRLYSDSDHCVFEVKMKVTDDETDKRQIDHPVESRAMVTDRAAAFLAETLRERRIDPPSDLDQSLRTRFRRCTMAAAAGADRVTCDFDLELARGGASAAPHPGRIVLETKSETGETAADAALADLGAEPVSFSKYRAGIELLTDLPERGAQRGREPAPSGAGPAGRGSARSARS